MVRAVEREMLSSSIMDFSVRHWWVWRRASDWAIWSALMVQKGDELLGVVAAAVIRDVLVCLLGL